MEEDHTYSGDTLSTKYRWIQDSYESTNYPSISELSFQNSSFLHYDLNSLKTEKIHQLAELLDDTQMLTKTIKKDTILRATHIPSSPNSNISVKKSITLSDDQSKMISSFDKYMESYICKKTSSPKSSSSVPTLTAQNDQSFLEPSLLESSGVSNCTVSSMSPTFLSKNVHQEASYCSIPPKKSSNQSETSSRFSWDSETVKEYLNEILKQIYPDRKENIKPHHESTQYTHFSNFNTNATQENAVSLENIVNEKSYTSKDSEKILDLMKEKLLLDTSAPNFYIDVSENCNALKLQKKDRPETCSNEKAPTSLYLEKSDDSYAPVRIIISNKSHIDEKKYVELDLKQTKFSNIDPNQKNQNSEVQHLYEDYSKYKEDIINIQNSLKQLVSEYDRRGHMLDKLINEFLVLKTENANQNNENALKISFDETKKHALFVEKDLDAARLEIADLKTICHDLIEALKIKPQNIQKYYPSTPKVVNEESLKEKMTRWKTYLSPHFSPIQGAKSFCFTQNANVCDKKEPLHDLNIPVDIQSPLQKTPSILDKQNGMTPQQCSTKRAFEGDNETSSHEKAEQEIARLKSNALNISHEHHTKPITPQDMPDAHKSLSKTEKIYYRLQLHKIDKLCSNEASNLLKNILVQLNIPFDSLPETIMSIRCQLQQSLRLREFAEEVHLSLYEGEPMDPKLVSKKCLGDMITKVDQLARSSRRRRIRRSII
ncbi:hypothetical protein PCANB_002035 [Pneumocystis canis]|nr:hypothetical protein PCANB_002035 [Pneumocystis canis]